jgi:hypothetical protein
MANLAGKRAVNRSMNEGLSARPKRRRKSVAMSKPTKRRRKTKRGLLSAKNNNTVLAMQMVEAAIGGALGAIVFKIIPIVDPKIRALAVAGGGVLVATQMNKPLAAAGMIGVAAANLGTALKLPLLAEDMNMMQETEFVEIAAQNSNPMYVDSMGNQVFPIGGGMMINDDGELSEDLQEDFITITSDTIY